MSSTEVPRVVPAQLSFLAIYSPALGDSDETFHQQIVFYYAKAAKARARLGHGDTQHDAGLRGDKVHEKLRGEKAHEEKLREEKLRERLRDEENEKLRQVGLAQGMVGFARSFSDGETVDAIETERSRIVLHELEGGWWVLASIDLTQLPAAGSAHAVEYSGREVSPPALLVQQLVRAHGIFTLHHGWPLQQLLRKHGRAKFCSILHTYWARFCAQWDVLLHGSPAVDMFNGLKLAAGGELGMGVGEEEWGSSERDVLEHFARRTEGLVDVLVSRFGDAPDTQANDAPGRKNDDAPGRKNDDAPGRKHDDAPAEPWIGCRGNVAATDGVVFSGVGGLSRASLRDMAHWTETIYHYGDHAYGIRDNPTSDRRRRRRRDAHASRRKTAPPAHEDEAQPHDSGTGDAPRAHQDEAQPHDSGTGDAPRIPPPIVKAVESSLDKASRRVDEADGRPEPPAHHEPGTMLASLGDTDTWIKYMKLGYGTAWGARKQAESLQSPSDAAREQSADAAREQSLDAAREQSPEAMRYVEPAPDVDLVEEKRKAQVRAENGGYFLIGLKGDMVEADMDENDEGDWNARIPLRTVYVEQVNKPSSLSESDTPGEDNDSSLDAATKLRAPGESNGSSFHTATKLEKSRLRPVVYVHRPFIYTFLFAHRTPSLTLTTFYRSLHAFLAPLHRSLDRNTAPARVAQRLLAAQHPQTTASSAPHAPNPPIYDLVWDPRTLTLHTSLPNIPDPGTLMAEGLSSPADPWPRADALSVHAQILSTIVSSRRSLSEIERTCKTARGWWVVWMRLPPSQPACGPGSRDVDVDDDDDDAASHARTGSVAFNTEDLREAFLVRRARDADPAGARPGGSGRSLASGMWSGLGMGGGGASQSQRMGGKAAGWGPKGLADGIGIDARRYVDELLSLNR